jgi:hypothetical protein
MLYSNIIFDVKSDGAYFLLQKFLKIFIIRS